MPLVTALRIRTRRLIHMLPLVIASAALARHAHAADTRAWDGRSLHVALRAHVSVHHAQVTLGDVADVRENASASLPALEALPLGPAPIAGDTVRIDRSMLARWIAARAGVASIDIAWSGAHAVSVERATREVLGREIAQAARESLRAWLARDGAQVAIAVANEPPDVVVPEGVLRIEPRRLSQYASDAALLARRMSVWVDLEANNRFVRTVPVDFNVNVSGPAYVARQPLKAGTRLSPALVSVENVLWTGRMAAPLRPERSATGESPLTALRVRHALAPGDALTAAAVERTPLVVRGGWATLRESDAGVRLESRVEVLDDGRLGERVQVKLPNAHEALYARVTGPEAVEIAP